LYLSKTSYIPANNLGDHPEIEDLKIDYWCLFSISIIFPVSLSSALIFKFILCLNLCTAVALGSAAVSITTTSLFLSICELPRGLIAKAPVYISPAVKSPLVSSN
jgi:hypothetical protein